MATDLIRYDLLVQNAFRDIFRKVLADVAAKGLPGDHHFLVTFRTGAPGVKISERLRQAHPQDMTIVLQHQFWDLTVTDTGFSVGLSFKNVPEKLVVPFAAVTGFFDPSVNFGAEFTVEAPGLDVPALPGGPKPLALATVKRTRGSGSEPTEVAAPDKSDGAEKPARKAPAAESTRPAPAAKAPATEARPPDASSEGPKVVSIDAFRKKDLTGMTADVVNLRRARKTRDRRAGEAAAAANRAAHGTPRAQRTLSEARRELESRRLEAHRREDDGGS